MFGTQANVHKISTYAFDLPVLLADFRPKSAQQTVPDNEHARVIGVARGLGVVHAVVRRSVQDVFKHPQLLDLGKKGTKNEGRCLKKNKDEHTNARIRAESTKRTHK